MPELKNFPETKVRDLKVRDITTYGRVVGTDVKIKWALVTFEGQVGHYTERMLADQVIGCSREVLTEEEKAAKQLARSLSSLDFKEASDRKNLAAAREKMRTDMETGVSASHWSWLDVPLHEAQVRLWDAVAHAHKVRALSDEPFTRIEAVKFVLEQRMKKALSYYSALSRSTSVASNLFDDIEQQALSRWARELEWIVD